MPTPKGQTVAEWLEENRENYDDRKKYILGCIRELGVTEKCVRNKVARYWPSDYRRPPAKNKRTGMTRGQFAAQYDCNTKIRDAIQRGIQQLMRSENPEDDMILKDTEFRAELCGNVAAMGWRQIAGEQEFLKYQFRSRQDIFWTTPRTKKWALENVSNAREL